MSTLDDPRSLDATVLADRRAQLMAERAHLLEVAGLTAEDLSTFDPEDPTRGRDAVSAGIGSMTATALAEVEAALARVAAGTYGACGECGARIPEERLEIMPATAYCVGCRSRLG
ncbi:MAG: TraR/DksA family transcriptional regulator [Acidimicrobiales bacterium]